MVDLDPKSQLSISIQWYYDPATLDYILSLAEMSHFEG
jgi:hypothetical protein